MSKRKIKLGVIADDFTGAGDAASFLIKGGNKTILYTKIPDSLDDECDCIVIAMKIRSVKPQVAIDQVKEAVDFFNANGVEKIYYKFCSTFDSTPEGNIGVVMDFLLDYQNVPYSILCPSLPVNGRQVRDGVLYVNGVPLSESPLKDHPLNPMWDSYIPTLMKDQSKYPVCVVNREDMKYSPLHVVIENKCDADKRFYLVPDYYEDSDGVLISELFRDLTVIGGGSGLLEHLFRNESTETAVEETEIKEELKEIILCGSCSAMTRKQIEHYRKSGGTTYAVDSKRLLDRDLTANDIFEMVMKNLDTTILIYSDAVEKDMSVLSVSDTFIQESQLMEQLMSDLSAMAQKNDFDRIVVAGGETSGAVTLRLGYSAYYIGEVIAPGVPTMMPLNNKNLKLILKSGNFGKEDFFIKASGRMKS